MPWWTDFEKTINRRHILPKTQLLLELLSNFEGQKRMLNLRVAEDQLEAWV